MKSITICPFCKYVTTISSRMQRHIQTKKHSYIKQHYMNTPELSDDELHEIINKKLM